MDQIRQGEQFKKLFNLPDTWEAFEDITAKFYLKAFPSVFLVFKKSEGTILNEKQAYSSGNIIGIFFRESETLKMRQGVWSVEFKLDYKGSETPIWKPSVDIFNVELTVIK